MVNNHRQSQNMSQCLKLSMPLQPTGVGHQAQIFPYIDSFAEGSDKVHSEIKASIPPQDNRKNHNKKAQKYLLTDSNASILVLGRHTFSSPRIRDVQFDCVRICQCMKTPRPGEECEPISFPTKIHILSSYKRNNKNPLPNKQRQSTVHYTAVSKLCIFVVPSYQNPLFTL